MQELILLKEEIDVLKDLDNNHDKTEILRDLIDYGLAKGIWTDSNGCIKAWLTVNGKQLIRHLENKKLLDGLTIELNFGIVKIKF